MLTEQAILCPHFIFECMRLELGTTHMVFVGIRYRAE